ncbi:MAG: hypothetical protein ACFCU3_09065 [Verrucomicrobiales bacterium]
MVLPSPQFSQKHRYRPFVLGLIIVSLAFSLTGCADTVEKLRQQSEEDARRRAATRQGLPAPDASPTPTPTPPPRTERDMLREIEQPGARAVDPRLPNRPAEQDFDSFLAKLRQAVVNKDMDTIASLMTPNFGYSLSPLMEGPGVFEYWDVNNRWPELQRVVAQRFVPSSGFMVAPPEFGDPNTTYTGYRAGMVRTPNGWRFSYFVSGE